MSADVFLFAALAAINFGMWQGSWAAMGFMFCALVALGHRSA